MFVGSEKDTDKISVDDETSRLLGSKMADADEVYDDRGFLGSRFREWRHDPCMMQPLSFIMILIFACFMLITLTLQAPALLLGLLLSPILTRSSWYVEFLYPWDIARWAHFFLIRITSSKADKADDKNRGFHSRTLEQKIEVVPNRVYIHPIPQWLDNLGYLIVCLPPKATAENHGNVNISVEDTSNKIVAIMVDCGEAPATIRAVEMIQQHHYKKQPIQIQAILSTHKHHDHTGGNAGLLKSKLGINITNVFAAAVETVPHCTDPLVNGDKIPLPKAGSNNMDDLVEVEAVAVPAHTRGSLVYRLSCKGPTGSEFLFTGDTMFSAGSGVSFEADTGSISDSKLNRSNGNTFIRAGIGSYAMERCFAEILVRGMPDRGPDCDMTKVLIFPGHEYTSELLSRQFASALSESCRWKSFVPRDFFDTVSHLFVALHRRSLPHNSGKILMIPSILEKELHISPQFRLLHKSAEFVIRAIQFWFDNFCKDKDEVEASVDDLPSDEIVPPRRGTKSSSGIVESTIRRWNVVPEEVGQDIFTTLYTADLESVIRDLMTEKISKQEAADRLRGGTQKLADPVVSRRAIPGYLPSDKGIYRGIAGLALLGAGPSAMTLKDSRTMKLPPPIDSNSDRIRISKNRLVLVLGRLGLLKGRNALIPTIIDLLWKEASVFVIGAEDGTSRKYGDVEASSIDEIELGVLKWTIYGVPANQPSWFSKLCCMPCSEIPEIEDFPDHPSSKMKQKTGDLVSHDVLTCLLCRTSTGCFQVNRVEVDDNDDPRPDEVKEVTANVELPSSIRMEEPIIEMDVRDDQTVEEDSNADVVIPTEISPTPPLLSSSQLESPPSSVMPPLAMDTREAQSFNSFSDYDAEKDGIVKMSSLQNLLKEHEP